MVCKRIIIVEDNKLLLKNCVTLFNINGFTAVGADSAHDFLELLSESQFDIAVVDIGLPDRSGLDIVEYLRTETSMGIIVMTARASLKDKIKGYSSGADYYLTKPVDKLELLAVVESLCDRLGEVEQEVNKQWHIDSETRLLVSPNNVSINLTPMEALFLKALMKQMGQPITRKVILEHLLYNTSTPYGDRALDVLVVRLRKKISKHTEEPNPIKTIRLFGYSFIRL